MCVLSEKLFYQLCPVCTSPTKIDLKSLEKPNQAKAHKGGAFVK